MGLSEGGWTVAGGFPHAALPPPPPPSAEKGSTGDSVDSGRGGLRVVAPLMKSLAVAVAHTTHSCFQTEGKRLCCIEFPYWYTFPTSSALEKERERGRGGGGRAGGGKTRQPSRDATRCNAHGPSKHGDSPPESSHNTNKVFCLPVRLQKKKVVLLTEHGSNAREAIRRRSHRRNRHRESAIWIRPTLFSATSRLEEF
jgi:hypothetical protein